MPGRRWNAKYCSRRCWPTSRPRYVPQRGKGLSSRLNKTATNRLWRKANPEKYRAHNAVAYALWTGKLDRSQYCQLCLGTGRIESHHPDYNRLLDVVWLCHWCHSAIEGRSVKYRVTA